MNPGVSFEQVAQILNSVAATRPNEFAMQDKLRAAQEENQRLQTRLSRANASLEALAKRFNDQQETASRYAAAYTAIKRGLMMRDMQAMAVDYLTGENITSEDMEANKARMTHDVTDLFNTAVADGVVDNILKFDDTTPLFSNDADNKWLMDQLQHDIAKHPYNIWSK